MKAKSINRKELIKEVSNSISHGIGVVLGIVALVFLMIKAQTKIEYLAYAIYGASIIVLFLASTLYHSFSFTKLKTFFRKLDHSSIFILIAGTYTPYILLGIGGFKGTIISIIIWAIGIFGIVIKLGFFEWSRKIDLFLYLAMGWICVFFVRDIYSHIGLKGLLLLLGGGISYSIGVIFYVKKNMYLSHFIWHIFVLGASVLMFLSVYKYV